MIMYITKTNTQLLYHVDHLASFMKEYIAYYVGGERDA